MGGRESRGGEERLRGLAEGIFLGLFSTHSAIRNGCPFDCFYWEILRKDKTWVVPSWRNPQAGVGGRDHPVIQQTLTEPLVKMV